MRKVFPEGSSAGLGAEQCRRPRRDRSPLGELKDPDGNRFESSPPAPRPDPPSRDQCRPCHKPLIRAGGRDRERLTLGLSELEASVGFSHHRPRGTVGVGQRDGIDVSVAVPGDQGTDAGVCCPPLRALIGETPDRNQNGPTRAGRPAESGTPRSAWGQQLPARTAPMRSCGHRSRADTGGPRGAYFARPVVC